MRSPGMAIGRFVVSGFFSKGFDQKEKIGGLCQSIADWYAGADMEEGLVGSVDERGEADGF